MQENGPTKKGTSSNKGEQERIEEWQKKTTDQEGLNVCYAVWGCHLDPRLNPILGPSKSHPGSEEVLSRFAMCFVWQRLGPIQVPRWGPSRPVLVPSWSRAFLPELGLDGPKQTSWPFPNRKKNTRVEETQRGESQIMRRGHETKIQLKGAGCATPPRYTKTHRRNLLRSNLQSWGGIDMSQPLAIHFCVLSLTQKHALSPTPQDYKTLLLVIRKASASRNCGKDGLFKESCVKALFERIRIQKWTSSAFPNLIRARGAVRFSSFDVEELSFQLLKSKQPVCVQAPAKWGWLSLSYFAFSPDSKVLWNFFCRVCLWI